MWTRGVEVLPAACQSRDLNAKNRHAFDHVGGWNDDYSQQPAPAAAGAATSTSLLTKSTSDGDDGGGGGLLAGIMRWCCVMPHRQRSY